MKGTLYDKGGSGLNALTNGPQISTFPGARIHAASDQTVPEHCLIPRRNQTSIQVPTVCSAYGSFPHATESHPFLMWPT